MTYANRTLWIASLLALIVVGAAACNKGKKKAKTSGDAETAEVEKPDKAEPEEAPEVEKGLPDPDEVQQLSLKRVHFEFDQATLTEAAKQTLANNAEILRGHPKVEVRLEGHCDERGSTEYNLALGERRAIAVRDYLVDLGVTEDNLVTVSLGEEKPLEDGNGEGAWAKNRRAELVVVEGSDRVVGSVQ